MISTFDRESDMDKMLRCFKNVASRNLTRALITDIRPSVSTARKYSSTPVLPSLPVPKLNDTLTKFLETVEPHLSPEALAKTRQKVQRFGAPGGVGEQLQKLLEKRASVTENWLSDWWLQCAYLQYRDPVVVWSSPGLVWPQRKFTSEQDRIRFAAKVISAALQYKGRIDNKEIPAEFMGKSALDMAQYEKIFGTCRIPGVPGDSMQYNPESKHIVLVIDNEFYKVPVYDGSDVLSENQIAKQIVACTKQKGSEAPIGLLTTDHRDNWGLAYAELMKDPRNKESLKDIQTALFTVSLDKHQAPVKNADDVITACHQLIHGGGSQYNSGNRWYDKTVQFVIGENGINGLTYEHSPAEGVPIAVMTDFVIGYVDKNQTFNPTDVRNVEVPTKLTFSVNSNVQGALKVAASNIDQLGANLDMNYLHFTNYGKNFIKTQKMSPDSFIQMAIQFAFYRLHKVPGAHYESAALRLYKHGRTETIRSCSNESIAFAKAMLEPTSDQERAKKLTAAVNAHKKYVAAAVQGFGVDRHLLGLKLIAKENNIPLPSLYSDDGYIKSAHMRLSTSQVPSKYNAFMCYGTLTQDGYGCCYNPRNDDMWFGISSLHSDPSTSSESFRRCLKESLIEMHDVLVKAGVPKAKL